MFLPFLTFFATAPIYAQTLFPTTGSYYEVVSVKLTWSNARSAAETRSYLGVPGRLAVVTSQAESDFIGFSLLGSGSFGDSYWLGGWQPNGAVVGATDGWEWIDGEAWSYTNWEEGEPNDFVGYGFDTENALEIYNSALSGTWNDLADGNSGLSEGYIVEYAPVPEPSAALLACFGLGVVALRRRVRCGPISFSA